MSAPWLEDLLKRIGDTRLPPDRCRVLVVEDDEPLRQWLVESLDFASLPALGVGSVAQALEALDTYAPAVALVDKNLPDGNGLEVIRIGVATAPGTEFVIITGEPSLDSAIEAINLGAFGYLPKPFSSIDEVLRRVRAALERPRVEMLNELLGDRLRQMQEELERTRLEVGMVGEVLGDTRRQLRQELRLVVDQLLEPLAVVEEDVAAFTAFARDVADGAPTVRTRARAELGRLRMLEQIVRRLYLQTERTAERLDPEG